MADIARVQRSFRILSGIQPSGVPHIGNYLGSLRQWINLQNKKNECFFMIADMHAITVPYEARQLYSDTLTTAAVLLALGINQEDSTLFIQSHVPIHAQATWLLMNIAKMGELSRMTQFKEKGEGKESATVGLFSYPILQTADILLYTPDIVPIGEDQQQHLELARILARRFNVSHGRMFPEPKPYIVKETARIMSLSDPEKKMSKSDKTEGKKGVLFLNDDDETIQEKIRLAVTDSGTEVNPEYVGPAMANLVTIYSGFSGKKSTDVLEEFSGRSYSEFKGALAGLLVEKITPIRESISEHMENTQALLSTLQLGAEKAIDACEPVFRDMKRRMGFTEVGLGG